MFVCVIDDEADVNKKKDQKEKKKNSVTGSETPQQPTKFKKKRGKLINSVQKGSTRTQSYTAAARCRRVNYQKHKHTQTKKK